MFPGNLCYDTLPKPKQNEGHRSTAVIVNFEHNTPTSSVSAVVFEHVFISLFDLFYISIVFRLT